jgi:hypothetical protein
MIRQASNKQTNKQSCVSYAQLLLVFCLLFGPEDGSSRFDSYVCPTNPAQAIVGCGKATLCPPLDICKLSWATVNCTQHPLALTAVFAYIS